MRYFTRVCLKYFVNDCSQKSTLVFDINENSFEGDFSEMLFC